MALKSKGFKRALMARTPSTVALMAKRAGNGARITPARAAVMAHCAGAAQPVPKTEPKRNPHLLAMAKGQSCVLRIEEVCNRDPATVVAAHSNLSIHGKSAGRKADDPFHVHACSACHRWLDTGPAPAEVKELAFMAAHLQMIEMWRGIVAGFIDSAPRDKAAAQWALDHLNASPVGLESPL